MRGAFFAVTRDAEIEKYIRSHNKKTSHSEVETL